MLRPITLTLVTFLGLTGCSQMKKVTEFGQPATEQERCVQLKREILYQQSNPNREATWVGRKKQDQLKQRYREQCGEN